MRHIFKVIVHVGIDTDTFNVIASDDIEARRDVEQLMVEGEGSRFNMPGSHMTLTSPKQIDFCEIEHLHPVAN